MRKKLKYLLTIMLLIMSIAGIVSFYNFKQQRKQLDQLFFGNLVEARCAFGTDYNNIDDEAKIYNCLRASTNLFTAANIIDLTSYNDIENRNSLYGAIYDLHLCMTQKESRDKIFMNSEVVYKYLSNIIENPRDKDSTDQLEKLADDIYFNK